MGISAAIFATSGTWSGLPTPIAPLLRLFFLLGIFGTAVLWVAMAYYWYGFDPRSDGARGVWLLVLLLGPLGALIYYFVVYRRYSQS
jgi:hypothetical protein